MPADRARAARGRHYPLLSGATPIFRNARDAEITMRIYFCYPTLVDRSSGIERRAWPVRCVRMFDMTSDSALFMTRAKLQAKSWTR